MLDKYLAECEELEKPQDAAEYRKDVMRRLLKFFIRQSQLQYLQHLRGKKQNLEFEKESTTKSKVRSLTPKLLSQALRYDP